ncbi:hypothetical protein B0H14DRAFT_2561102 [Mycena olivaceomarginata]|nr:hypothetical protein B0H14DRAFT_2561102 [Mycena olivaceomarginata]
MRVEPPGGRQNHLYPTPTRNPVRTGERETHQTPRPSRAGARRVEGRGVRERWGAERGIVRTSYRLIWRRSTLPDKPPARSRLRLRPRPPPTVPSAHTPAHRGSAASSSACRELQEWHGIPLCGTDRNSPLPLPGKPSNSLWVAVKRRATSAALTSFSYVAPTSSAARARRVVRAVLFGLSLQRLVPALERHAPRRLNAHSDMCFNVRGGARLRPGRPRWELQRHGVGVGCGVVVPPSVFVCNACGRTDSGSHHHGADEGAGHLPEVSVGSPWKRHSVILNEFPARLPRGLLLNIRCAALTPTEKWKSGHKERDLESKRRAVPYDVHFAH